MEADIGRSGQDDDRGGRLAELAVLGVEVGEPAQRSQAGHEAVLAAAVDDELG